MLRIIIDKVYGINYNGYVLVYIYLNGDEDHLNRNLFSCKCVARVFVGDFIDKRFKVKKPCKLCKLRKI